MIINPYFFKGFTNTLSTTFDGVDEYVNFGNVVARKVQTQTISLWVKPLVASAESVLTHSECLDLMSTSEWSNTIEL